MNLLNRFSSFKTLSTITYASHLLNHPDTLSNTAPEIRSQCREAIQARYGESYLQERSDPPRQLHSQEAHEAIRPTSMKAVTLQGPTFSETARRVYAMIWCRTMAASQMKNYGFQEVTYWIRCGPYRCLHTDEVPTFWGWKAVGRPQRPLPVPEARPLDRRALPFQVLLKGGTIVERLPAPLPQRYSESSLIRSLEQKGIGRPSTYAGLCSTLLQRQYVSIQEAPGVGIRLSYLEFDETHTI